MFGNSDPRVRCTAIFIYSKSRLTNLHPASVGHKHRLRTRQHEIKAERVRQFQASAFAGKGRNGRITLNVDLNGVRCFPRRRGEWIQLLRQRTYSGWFR